MGKSRENSLTNRANVKNGTTHFEKMANNTRTNITKIINSEFVLLSIKHLAK